MDYYVVGATVAINSPWDSATHALERAGPDPKLNGRNESEDYFCPCRLRAPLTSHAKRHHTALVSPSVRDTQTPETAWSARSWSRRSPPEADRSATDTQSSALAGAAPLWGLWELRALC